MNVVADTSPLYYLLLTGLIDLAPRLFERVVIPVEVLAELSHPRAPAVVREWASRPPSWLDVVAVVERARHAADAQLGRLDPGERAAILLAEQIKSDLVVLDDRLGRKVAMDRGLAVTGLLGLLKVAAARGLVDLPTTISALRQAGFRVAPGLLRKLLDGPR